MDKRIYINGAIAYLFLGFLFLLAKKNPAYSSPYVQLHAKRASKIHLLFFLCYIIYEQLIVPLYIYLPFFPDIINLAGNIAFFAGFIGYILYSAYAAYTGKQVSEKEKEELTHDNVQYFFFGTRSFSLGKAKEQDKALLLLSSIPFFGFFLEARHQHPFVALGSYLGTI